MEEMQTNAVEATMPTADSQAETSPATPQAAGEESSVQSEGTAEPVKTAAVTMPSADKPERAAQADGRPGEKTAAITIPVRYNHQSRQLSAAEATALAQKGLKYDELSPMLDKIRLLAAGCGKSVTEMVDGLVAAGDQALYRRLLEEAGGNEQVAGRLMELEKTKRQTALAEAAKTQQEREADDRQALADRLATEFMELQSDFPEVQEFSAVPKSVVQTAIDKNISLYDAYLRYERAEGKKAAQAAQQQAVAAAASVGSRSDAPPQEAPDPVLRAMEQGFRSVLS